MSDCKTKHNAQAHSDSAAFPAISFSSYLAANAELEALRTRAGSRERLDKVPGAQTNYRAKYAFAAVVALALFVGFSAKAMVLPSQNSEQERFVPASPSQHRSIEHESGILPRGTNRYSTVTQKRSQSPTQRRFESTATSYERQARFGSKTPGKPQYAAVN